MKKSIVALAVLAAGLAQADGTTLYGSVRMAYTYDSKGSIKANINENKNKSTSKFGDNGSRFGIKGSDDLGNGLSAFYKYENRIGKGHAETNKLYAGLEGGFGKVSIGKQNWPRDELSNYSDPTNQFETDYGRAAETSSDNSFAYVSPDMGGLSFAAAVVANGKIDGTGLDVNRHIDAYDLLAQYSANGFYAGVGYQQLNPKKGYAVSMNKAKNVGLGVGYGNDMFEVGLLAEKEMNKGPVDPLFARLGGAYNFSEMDKVYGSVSYHDPDTKALKKVKGATVGYQHNFSKQTRVWAEYGYKSKEVKGGKTSNKVGLGLRTDF
ncbi:MAG: hypothetical protein CR975_00925 [Gammaproteobacteria bacterium]|nr:MAG: hypothetical protein CR975_00925 [Gammaproteobacteria bacterium]